MTETTSILSHPLTILVIGIIFGVIGYLISELRRSETKTLTTAINRLETSINKLTQSQDEMKACHTDLITRVAVLETECNNGVHHIQKKGNQGR